MSDPATTEYHYRGEGLDVAAFRAEVWQARNAGRAVYFEMGANQLAIFMAIEYGAFGTLTRSMFDTFMPQLATWLPAAEVQGLVMAYLGHTGYSQLAADEALPAASRRVALTALSQAHEQALDHLRRRVFSPREIASLEEQAESQQARLLAAQAEGERGRSGRS